MVRQEVLDFLNAMLYRGILRYTGAKLFLDLYTNI